MSPQSPDLPETWRRVSAPATPPWPYRLTIIASGLLATLTTAAWVVPPRLDWGRFRTGIESIAAAELGRPVTIGGEVTLRLLPEAVLTAADVTLPDQGDGVSASIGALRLQVAVLPLLAGHIVPRDLVLGQPVLRLPWPLSERLAHPTRPKVPHAFAAHVEGGALQLGQARVTGINAALHGGPEPAALVGTLPQDPGMLAFGAEGFATFAGRNWRFTSALGAPDADGVSAVDLAVRGQMALGQTGAKLRGTLADGVVQGRLEAGGPDLSQLMPAARLVWRAEAPFVADGDHIEAPAISLSLGGAPAEASFALRLASPARLDARIHAASLDLDGWARLLRAGTFRSHAGLLSVPKLPARIDWSADAAQVLGGTLHGLHGALLSDGARLTVENATATLPGNAVFAISGAVVDGPEGLRLSGPARLDAPNLHATLAWLRPVLPALLDAVPSAVLTRATLTGTAALDRSGVSVTSLAGDVDGAHVTGKFGVAPAARPHIGLDLAFDRLGLDEWLGTGGQGHDITLAGLGTRSSAVDSDIHLHASTASWGDQTLQDLALAVRTGAPGLVVDHAATTLDGARLAASFALAPDGTIADGRLHVASAELAAAREALPARWRWADGLMRGPGLVEASLAGPQHALVAAMRVEADDAVLEAEWHGDAAARAASGTVTLRHPGAPRLLAALGVPGAETWLDTGSVSFRSPFSVSPSLVSLDGFELTAADLRLAGKLAFEGRAATPLLHGDIHADMLALPASWRGGAVSDWWRRWDVRLGLSADQVALGRRPFAGKVTGRLEFSGGAGVASVSQATVMGGVFTGALAFDAGVPMAALALRGKLTDIGIGRFPIASSLVIDGGRMDADLDLLARGAGIDPWRGVQGQVRLSLRALDVTGLDFSAASRALAFKGRAARAALQTALASGQTGGLSGEAIIDVAAGRISLAPTRLESENGAISVTGTADLPAGTGDLKLALTPAGYDAPGAGLRVIGPLGAARVIPDPGHLAATQKRHR